RPARAPALRLPAPPLGHAPRCRQHRTAPRRDRVPGSTDLRTRMAVLLLSTTILTLALAAWLYGRNERARAEAKAAQAALEKAEARIEQLEEKLDTAYETIASMRRDGFVAPPRPNPNNAPENLPADVSEILS